MQDYTGAFEKIAGKRGLLDSMTHASETLMRTMPAVPNKSLSNVPAHYARRADQLTRAAHNKLKANGGFDAIRKQLPTEQAAFDRAFGAISSGISKNRHLSDMDKHRALRIANSTMGR